MRNYGWTVTFYGAVLETVGNFGPGGGSSHLGGGPPAGQQGTGGKFGPPPCGSQFRLSGGPGPEAQVRDAIVAQLNGVMEELDSAQEAKEFLAEHLGN